MYANSALNIQIFYSRGTETEYNEETNTQTVSPVRLGMPATLSNV